MKRSIDIAIIVTLAILFLASLADAQRTSRLTRPCPGTAVPASVEVERDGDVTITPCAGRTINTTAAGTLRVYDPAYTPAFTSSATTRFTVGSTTTQTIPAANIYIGADLFHQIAPANTTTKVFTGVRNIINMAGSSATGQLSIYGSYNSLLAIGTSWVAPPLSDVVGTYSSIDLAMQNGATNVHGTQSSAIVGSVNVGNITELAGVWGAAASGYASNVTNSYGVVGRVQTGTNSGGVTTHAAALGATRTTITANVTNLYGLRVGAYSGSVTGTITNNYGVFIDDTTDDHGTNRWALYSQSVAPSFLSGKLSFDATYTAGGTTGNQTINKPAFSVNFAAAASSLTVTNSFVTTASMLICTVQTNDGTLKSVAAVAGSGSVVLHANAAATAETKVYCEVRN